MCSIAQGQRKEEQKKQYKQNHFVSFGPLCMSPFLSLLLFLPPPSASPFSSSLSCYSPSTSFTYISPLKGKTVAPESDGGDSSDMDDSNDDDTASTNMARSKSTTTFKHVTPKVLLSHSLPLPPPVFLLLSCFLSPPASCGCVEVLT